MRDAISGLIGRYDQLGRYLDRSAIDSIEGYLSESTLRIQAVELINREAAEIVREASQRLFRDEPELLQRISETMGGWPARPGGVEDATKLVSDDIVNALTISGNVSHIKDRVQEWMDAGISYPVLLPLSDNYDEMAEKLAPLTEATFTISTPAKPCSISGLCRSASSPWPSLPFSPLPQDQTFPLLSTANVWFVPQAMSRKSTPSSCRGVNSRYCFMSPDVTKG